MPMTKLSRVNQRNREIVMTEMSSVSAAGFLACTRQTGTARGC